MVFFFFHFRESWPQSEVLLSKSPTAFFQGTARCSSPFRKLRDTMHATITLVYEMLGRSNVVIKQRNIYYGWCD